MVVLVVGQNEFLKPNIKRKFSLVKRRKTSKKVLHKSKTTNTTKRIFVLKEIKAHFGKEKNVETLNARSYTITTTTTTKP